MPSAPVHLAALPSDPAPDYPASSEGNFELFTKLVLHARGLRAHVDIWIEEQERLLSVASFSHGPAPPLGGLASAYASTASGESLGACSYSEAPDSPLCTGKVDWILNVSDPFISEPPIEEEASDERRNQMWKPHKSWRARSQRDTAILRGTTPSESDSVSAPFDPLSSFNTSQIGQNAMFTPEHVAEILNSTPGLRQVRRVSTRLNSSLQAASASMPDMPMPRVVCDAERSFWFHALCNVAIVVNTVLLTASVEEQASGKPDNEAFEALELGFCLFYSAELLLRVAVHRLGFFVGAGSGWHLLDAVLVFVSVIEQIGRLVSSDGGLNVSYLRAIRLMKIMKVLRILRVMRSLRELRLLLDSILGSARALVWSILVMIFTTFLFAICFAQAASNPIEAERRGPARAPWNSIGPAMSALFMAATGGIDWQTLAEDLIQDGITYYLLFFFYIGVFLFVIENALTSLFVEKLLDSVATDETNKMQNRLGRRIEDVKKIEGLFEHMDQDGLGEVSYEQLCELVHDPRMSAFAASLDIDESDLTTCFSIITGNGQLKIDADRFVVGCIKLRGQAKSVDIIDICLTQTQIVKAIAGFSEEQKRFANFCSRQFRALHKGSEATRARVSH